MDSTPSDLLQGRPFDKNELFEILLTREKKFSDKELRELRAVYRVITNTSEFNVKPELTQMKVRGFDDLSQVFHYLLTEAKVAMELKAINEKALEKIRGQIQILTNYQVILKLDHENDDAFTNVDIHYIDHKTGAVLLDLLQTQRQKSIRDNNGAIDRLEIIRMEKKRMWNQRIDRAAAEIEKQLIVDGHDLENYNYVRQDVNRVLSDGMRSFDDIVHFCLQNDDSLFGQVTGISGEKMTAFLLGYLTKRSTLPGRKFLRVEHGEETYYLFPKSLVPTLNDLAGEPRRRDLFIRLQAVYEEVYGEPFRSTADTPQDGVRFDETVEREKEAIPTHIMSLPDERVHSVEAVVAERISALPDSIDKDGKQRLTEELQAAYEDYLASNNTAFSCFKIGWDVYFFSKQNLRQIYDRYQGHPDLSDTDKAVLDKLKHIVNAQDDVSRREETAPGYTPLPDKSETKPIYLDYVGELARELLRKDPLPIERIEQQVQAVAEKNQKAYVLEFINQSTIRERESLIQSYLRDWYRVFAYLQVHDTVYFVLKDIKALSRMMDSVQDEPLRDEVRALYQNLFATKKDEEEQARRESIRKQKAEQAKRVANYVDRFRRVIRAGPANLAEAFPGIEPEDALEVRQALLTSDNIISAYFLERKYFFPYTIEGLVGYIDRFSFYRDIDLHLDSAASLLKELGLKCAFLQRWRLTESLPHSTELLNTLADFRAVFTGVSCGLVRQFLRSGAGPLLPVFQHAMKSVYALLDETAQKAVFSLLQSDSRAAPAGSGSAPSSAEVWSLKTHLVKQQNRITYDRNGHFHHSGSSSILDFRE